MKSLRHIHYGGVGAALGGLFGGGAVGTAIGSAVIGTLASAVIGQVFAPSPPSYSAPAPVAPPPQQAAQAPATAATEYQDNKNPTSLPAKRKSASELQRAQAAKNYSKESTLLTGPGGIEDQLLNIGNGALLGG